MDLNKVIFIFLIGTCHAANILGIFPFTAHSHFTMFKALLEELHMRGHHLTVVSHFPKRNITENYTDISLVGATKSLHSNMSLSNLSHFGLIDNLRLLNEQIDDYEPIFQVPEIQNLMKTNRTFDLILTEIFNTDLFLGFYHKFKCPNIALSASPLMPWAYSRIGLPIEPSTMPLIFSNRANPMSAIDIVINTLDWNIAIYYYKNYMNRKSEEIARKYFGELPSLEDLASETSLILVNTHSSLHGYLPKSHKLIEVGGIHIQQPNPLPEDLEIFLNESKNGIIVFSMGSMFRAESIPKRLFDIFINVFSRLKENILWKWESGQTPQVANIKYMKWLPQRDILAHKNVRLFIYHGGLLGTSEAVHCGVPILGLPQFGDMGHNLAALGDAAISLALSSLTEELLEATIRRLIDNPKDGEIKEGIWLDVDGSSGLVRSTCSQPTVQLMRQLSVRHKLKAAELSVGYRDREMEPLARAVYWTEYTLRHNGTRHLTNGSPPPLASAFHRIAVLALLSLILLLLVLLLLIQIFSYIKSTNPRQKIKDV